MKLLTPLGRLLAVLFWLALLVNLIAPFAKPFALLVNLVGTVLLFFHVLLLALCHGRLQASAWPTRERLLLLLFGTFYVDALPAPAMVVEQLLRATDVAPVEAPVLGTESEPTLESESESESESEADADADADVAAVDGEGGASGETMGEIAGAAIEPALGSDRRATESTAG